MLQRFQTFFSMQRFLLHAHAMQDLEMWNGIWFDHRPLLTITTLPDNCVQCNCGSMGDVLQTHCRRIAKWFEPPTLSAFAQLKASIVTGSRQG